MIERLLIVGGSVRAAAMSVRRAGFEPIAIDRFADADLQRVCGEFQRYDELRQLPDLARRMAAADWIYTGPLENYPKLIEQLGQHRNLLGNQGATLRQLRDPWCLANALGKAGLRSPELSAAGDVPVGQDWLRKPLRAAGGFGIARCAAARTGRGGQSEAMYFQRFISGRSIGAMFLGAKGRTVLVGATEQLLGPTWGASREFQYVGSVGPVVLSAEQTRALQRIGDCIASSFRVEGLFGVDAIINDHGVWPVEVNPRYAASVEILERAFNLATIRWHVAVCRGGELPDFSPQPAAEDHIDRYGKPQYGKAIVYANRDVMVDARLERELFAWNHGVADPLVADIPVAGTNIPAGDPMVTVFAKGTSELEVQEGLHTAMADVQRLFRTIPQRH